MGGGFALGAKLARPDHEVWLLWGDGSAGYSIAEFDTFRRHNVRDVSTDVCAVRVMSESCRVALSLSLSLSLSLLCRCRSLRWLVTMPAGLKSSAIKCRSLVTAWRAFWTTRRTVAVRQPFPVTPLTLFTGSLTHALTRHSLTHADSRTLLYHR